MLRTIIKREIQEYLKSAKFLIGFLITVALITISTLINLNDFKQRQADYQAAREEKEGPFYRITAYRAPEALSVLVQGKDRKLGNKLEISSNSLPSRLSGYMGQGYSQHQGYMAGFEAVDFAFVVRIVLSLLVIFLAYNSVAEEKSNGTLKLALANSLPRDKLLFGKFISGGVVVLGSLVIAAIMALLLIISDPAISLGASDWARILAMLGVSAFYLFGFYALSLFISVKINRPATSLMVLLQVWVFLLIIYPSLGVFLAGKVYRLPNEEEISGQKEAVSKPIMEEMEKNSAAIMDAQKKGQRWSTDLSKKSSELLSRQAEANYMIDLELNNMYSVQAHLSKRISIFSPAVLYDEAMLRLARTGMDEYENFMAAVPGFWKQIVERDKLMYQDREAYQKSKLPEFSYSRESTARSMTGAAMEISLLFLFIVVFFSLAYTGFLRKDVR
jgi:ABC-type transport system involved in multi-copper enzyme maturation permease subunit